MKNYRSGLLLILLVIITNILSAQNEEIRIRSSLPISDSQSSFTLDSIEISIFKDGVKEIDKVLGDSGEFDFSLDLGYYYDLKFSRPNYVTKIIRIDTRNISDDDRVGGFQMQFQLTLFKYTEGFNLDILSAPIAKAAFDPQMNFISFDMEYSAGMQKKIEEEFHRLESDTKKQNAQNQEALNFESTASSNVSISSDFRFTKDSLQLSWNNSHIEAVTSACFGKNDNELVTYTWGTNYFFLWDLQSGKMLQKVFTPEGIEELFYNRDKESFVIKGVNNFYYWNTQDLKQFTQHKSSIEEKNRHELVELSDRSIIAKLKEMQLYDSPYLLGWYEMNLEEIGLRVVTDLMKFMVFKLSNDSLVFSNEFNDFPLLELVVSPNQSMLCMVNGDLGDGGAGDNFVRILDLRKCKEIVEMKPTNSIFFELSKKTNNSNIYSVSDHSVLYFNSSDPTMNSEIQLKDVNLFDVGENVYAVTRSFLNNNEEFNFVYKYDMNLNLLDSVTDSKLLLYPLEVPEMNELIVSTDSGCEIFNNLTLEKKSSLVFSENYAHNTYYSSEDRKYLFSSENKIYSVDRNKQIEVFEIFDYDEWSPDGPSILKFYKIHVNTLLVFLTDGRLIRFDVELKKSKQIDYLKNLEITDVEKMGNAFLISTKSLSNENGAIWKFSLSENMKDSRIEKILDFENVVIDMLFENDFLYLSSSNRILVLYFPILKFIYSYEVFKNNNWLVQLHNSPYYMCSKDASKMLHYVTPSLKIIGFDQLDPVYNRPDIVLDSIGKYFGNEDRGMIEEYKKAWEKRIERLGLDKGKLSTGEIAVPNAEISNPEQISYENSDGKVIIHVKANDPKYNLRRYNVLVNEVPVYGSDGISIAELNIRQWERTDTIALSKGNNKIQVSVMNELGLENFKYPTYVNYTPEKEIESTTFYVGIGVNDFKDASRKLNYCVKDVQDLAQAFAKNQSKVDTLVFTNSEVTKENILELKSYLQKNTTVNDRVIISCSSHGLLDDSLNFYLATYDVDFAHPEKRGLAYEDLEGLLDGIPARQKLLLLDACNSGENERMFLQTNSADQLALAGMKGVNVEIVNEEINTFHQMTELFVNVRNNTGSVIIAASGGMQSAQEGRVVEGKKIENGAFTHSVLEYLAKEFNGQEKCTVNGMKNYVERRVEEITNAEQKPTSRQETMEVDWELR